MSQNQNTLDSQVIIDRQAKLTQFLRCVGQEAPAFGELKIVFHEGKIAYITKEEKIRIS